MTMRDATRWSKSRSRGARSALRSCASSGRPARRRGRAARLLRELRQGPDPHRQRRAAAERLRSRRPGGAERRRQLHRHRSRDPQDRTGLRRASLDGRRRPAQHAAPGHRKPARPRARAVRPAAPQATVTTTTPRTTTSTTDDHHDAHRHADDQHPNHPDDDAPDLRPRGGTPAPGDEGDARRGQRSGGGGGRRRGGAKWAAARKAANEQREIAGRYRLEGRLGFGGMSTVHLALDLRLERQVAVKLLAEHLADDPTFVSRFQREAQAAARLVHPNIVQVFDSGQDESTGQYFIVMEYIEGHPAPRSCATTAGWRSTRPSRSSTRRARAALRPPPRRRPPRRQAGQPAARARRRRQAGRLRHRQGHRAVEHHPGRLGARHRRLPRARAGPRRGGRPARRPLRARGRHLPADLRPPAV